ncbi:YbjN domain-containing protein [Flavobacteriaceae bacterium]|nr:YbjN domain-containing protein [Flavobacteriaceae bacterium]
MTLKTNKINGEIGVDLMEDIIKILPQLAAIHSADHSILIHGMGGQTRSFYSNLRRNKNVELLWSGWSSNVWWSYLLSFIPNEKVLTILNKVKEERTPDVSEYLENENNYFLLTVDFDYHGDEKDGEIFYRELIIGDKLDSEIKQNLIRKE